ncbi:aspirochlorine biosynthesis cytochrome P450 monooxygenase [Microdochium nivale]|nr:aspirochlorine biosynthesis cytochrome P450 monooxygenase [Microdochium nivale]
MPLVSHIFPKGLVPSDLLTKDVLPWLGGALVASPVVYYAIMAVYNIYFHPLSKYPGPKSWSATPFYYAILQLRGICPQETANMHRKYGPVVRISANELSFTYPGAWKDIYGHRKAGQPELAKDKRYHAAMLEQDLVKSDREYHSYLRKLLANGFSDSALRKQEPLIQDYLNTLMSSFHEKGSAGEISLDMSLWYNYFTFDVIGYLTYGESFNCLSQSALGAWIEALFGVVMVMAHAQAAARLPSIMRLPLMWWTTSPDIKHNFATSAGILDGKVKARLENKPPVPDFMEKLIEAYKKQAMSFNQLKQNSSILIGAGSETTAAALSGMTYLLATHPTQCAKLTAEVRTRFASAEDITMVSVNSCRYLLAVIEEGLRLYPPSAAAHPRYAPPGGITLNGDFVPENTLVGITTYAIMHSPDNWVNPDKFVPERWLPAEGDEHDGSGDHGCGGYRPEEYNRDNKEAFQVFSFGPRNCIGRNLAYAEMKLVLARLLWEFDIEYCGPEGEDWMDQKVFVVWMRKPLMIKLHPRRKV